jgi:hypothetical protein
LLLGGAYLAVLPWANCAFALGSWNPDMARFCTFGSGIAGFPRPLWPNVVGALIYIGAAAWTARTRRIDFSGGSSETP